jgi:hypothetical protein
MMNKKNYLIILISVLFLSFGWWFHNKTINKVKNELIDQTKLTNALQSKLTFTINRFNEVQASKLTLQGTIKDLKNENLNLSENQKKLLLRIESLDKDKKIISAALIKTKARLDSALFTIVDINEKDSSVIFRENNDSISFMITIGKVLPAYKNTNPTIMFDSLVLPNEMFIEFHWENNKKYYQKPVSFSVTNSNPLFKVYEMDSYIIPEINEKMIKPTGWQKIGQFLNKQKNNIIVFGVGALVGGILL